MPDRPSGEVAFCKKAETPCFPDLSCGCGHLPAISGVGHRLSIRCSARLEQISAGTTVQKPAFLLPVRGPGGCCPDDGSRAHPRRLVLSLVPSAPGCRGALLRTAGQHARRAGEPEVHLKAGAGGTQRPCSERENPIKGHAVLMRVFLTAP